MTILKRALCWLGAHRWFEGLIVDGHTKIPARRCQWCNRAERFDTTDDGDGLSMGWYAY